MALYIIIISYFFQLVLAPTELFSANAYEGGDTYYYHSNGEIFVFPAEMVDRLDSYNNVTGNNVRDNF